MFKNLKHLILQPRQLWEKNLIVLWCGTFMAGIAFSLIMPFLSLYIDTLGNFTKTELNFYSGITYSATFLVMAFVSPVWGKLADRKGRKLMILRASLGMAIVIALMGAVTNVYQLILLRLLQGVFSGYVSNSNALIATETPKKHSGKALGILITGNVTGTLFGPLFGGFVAANFGYRITFLITGIILFAVFLLSTFLVHENFVPIKKSAMKSAKEIFQDLPQRRIIIGMLLTTMLIQLGNFSISPVLSLYIRQLMHYQGPVTIVSGIIASLPGFSTLIAAPRLGALGDKIGMEKILMFGMLAAAAIYLPMAFAVNVWQLGILRFLIGITNAALLPAVQTLLAKDSPASATGRIFSYNQSFQALGNVSGPLVGSVVSGIWNYNSVFISTALIIFLGFFLVQFSVKPTKR
jgi:DHA1 family multidrug resistance protein-like MFS transporter